MDLNEQWENSASFAIVCNNKSFVFCYLFTNKQVEAGLLKLWTWTSNHSVGEI